MRAAVRRVEALFVTVLVLGTSTQPGLVLCHGADGHVEVESAGAHCCEGEPASQPEKPSASREPDAGIPGCGGCFDVTLQAEVTPLRRCGDPTIHILKPDLVFQATVVRAPRASLCRGSHRGDSAGPGAEQELVKLRSVVLLC